MSVLEEPTAPVSDREGEYREEEDEEEEDFVDRGGLASAVHLCPHLKSGLHTDINEETCPDLSNSELQCSEDSCSIDKECWLCLKCLKVFCGRYGAAHMLDHYGAEAEHCIALGMGDLSFWCYRCDSYLDHLSIEQVFRVYETVHQLKFSEPVPDGLVDQTRFVSKLTGGGSSESEYDLEELFDDEKTLEMKCEELSRWITMSKSTVIITGAGISTSASIPDYRGPRGAWTLRAKGERVKMDIELTQAIPTFSHMSLKSLMDLGQISRVITTNVDGLHRRSLIALDRLSELHGCIYTERCLICNETYLRTFDVTASLSGRSRLTGRQCERADCSGYLRDSTVAFGECLPAKELRDAQDSCAQADLIIVVGSSMRVSPACELPCLRSKDKGSRFVLMNLQRTPLDRDCDLRIHARCDDVFRKVMGHLDIRVDPFDVASLMESAKQDFRVISEASSKDT